MLLAAVTSFIATCAYADEKMNEFIDKLISEMTLEQKIGQLNLPTVKGDVVTGPEV